MSKRTIIVGDVHGCIDELNALLQSVGYRQRDDVLVLAGDLVAKGPASQEVVSAARELGALAVRGNHDEHILRWYRANADERAKLSLKLKETHRRAAESLSADDWHYLANLPLHLRVGGVLVVHAGVVPGRAFADQRGADLMNLRSITSAGEASFRVDDGVPWASLYAGPEPIVFGHDAIRGLQRYAFATGLDTGCCYGRELTALLLPEQRLVSVKARRIYTPLDA